MVFVIAKDDLGMAGGHHLLGHQHAFPDAVPAVNEIAQKHHLAWSTLIPVLVHPAAAGIAQPLQQRHQSTGTAVHIANQIQAYKPPRHAIHYRPPKTSTLSPFSMDPVASASPACLDSWHQSCGPGDESSTAEGVSCAHRWCRRVAPSG